MAGGFDSIAPILTFPLYGEGTSSPAQLSGGEQQRVLLARALAQSTPVLLFNGELKTFGTPQDVITTETIREAYQTPVEIIPHPDTGASIIFPQGAVRDGCTGYFFS